jgi:hypothetical protein
MDSSILHSNTVRTTFRVAALLFFPFLGFILANGLSQADSEGTFVNWHSLGKPSQGVVNIVGGNPWTVWWEAIDGQIYEGDIESCSNLEEACWKKSESIDTYYRSKKGPECESAFSNMKSPPGGFLKCFIVIDLGAEWYGETHYVLFQDGSLWYWKHSVSGLGPYGLIGVHGIMLCGGTVIGLLTGLIIFLYPRKPRKVLITP